MIRKIKALQEHFKTVLRELPNTVQEAINANATELESANREMLYSGERTDGSEIKPEYKPITVRIKERKGQPTNRVTLKDKGDFYKSIKVQAKRQSEVTFASNDKKAPLLTAKYATDKGKLLGVSRETLLRFAHLRVAPAIRKKLKP